ncbi:hypothetical protein ACF08N_07380 [Streptomyces sp. NPDC015127]|uniref:hypothetical protein n=1 Tax=Streptomyces sp. NPDC015127 TaxID=3364939 RepID=UPI0036F9A016
MAADQNDYEIEPGRGVTGLAFGESRRALRQRLGSPAPFRRSATSAELDDQYDELGLILSFDDRDVLGSIVLTAPARARLHGVGLLGEPVSRVVSTLAKNDVEFVADDGSWESDLGLALDCGGSTDPDSPVESVTVHESAAWSPEIELFFSTPEQQSDRTYVVTPGVGIPTVRLGESMSDVRARMGSGASWQPPFGPSRADSFWEEGVEVGYDADGAVSRIAVERPAQVLFEGMEIIGVPAGEIHAKLSGAGIPLISKEAEFVCSESGLRLLVARPGDDSLPVCGVIIE